MARIASSKIEYNYFKPTMVLNWSAIAKFIDLDQFGIENSFFNPRGMVSNGHSGEQNFARAVSSLP